MDRRHHDGRPHRRPVWRRHRASSPRCRVALGPAHGGRLVQERGGRQLAPARHGLRATRPLTSGRLDPPDICLIYGTPGQMIFFINGLQWTGYRKLSFTSVGESACADSWGKALKTGEPALTIPCYAERRYGGVADDELLM